MSALGQSCHMLSHAAALGRAGPEAFAQRHSGIKGEPSVLCCGEVSQLPAQTASQLSPHSPTRSVLSPCVTEGETVQRVEEAAKVAARVLCSQDWRVLARLLVVSVLPSVQICF